MARRGVDVAPGGGTPPGGVPQETHLAFDYTVLEIALMGRYPHLGVFELEGPLDVQIARDALAATGTRTSPIGCSRPERRREARVVIASALAQRGAR
jgi:iron complex transport system ATP-binding protein